LDIHTAIKNNDAAALNAILSRSTADINTRDKYDWSPIGRACENNNVACLKILLKYYVNPNPYIGTNYKSPLHIALINSNKEMQYLLLEKAYKDGLSAYTAKKLNRSYQGKMLQQFKDFLSEALKAKNSMDMLFDNKDVTSILKNIKKNL
jgi:ankyrin repeat protein